MFHLHGHAEVVQLRQRPLLDAARFVLAVVHVWLRGDSLRDQEEAATLSIRVAKARDGAAGVLIVIAIFRGVDKRVPVDGAVLERFRCEESELSFDALLH